MRLSLYNSMSRAVEAFQPLNPDDVRIYCCGPTVYDRPHVGNVRAMVVVDLLCRVLRNLYPVVRLVRNVTDVDDKIIERSIDMGITIDALTKQTLLAYHEDMATVGCLSPTIEPRATDHIPHMIAMIQRLIDLGKAYPDGMGNVLFRTRTMPTYGALSRLSQDGLIAGARVEISNAKEDPRDFVLWKPQKPKEPDHSAFDSPWGRGRPGWHIECSAMALEHLGPTFDIHMGGLDLRFPHHENEIAQSCCANGTDFMARYWVHNGFVVVEGQKMSKSLGNFFTVPDLVAKGYKGEAIRLALLETHYRAPLDVTETKLKAAQSRLDGLYRDKARAQAQGKTMRDLWGDPDFSSLMDDLKVSEALTNPANFEILGLLQQNPDVWFKGKSGVAHDARIETLVAERAQAKAAKDFVRADKIRNLLREGGIGLEDGLNGTTWRRI